MKKLLLFSTVKQDLNKTLLNIGFLGADREGKVGYDTLS